MKEIKCHNCREFGEKFISAAIKLKENQIERLSEDFKNEKSKDDKIILEGRIIQCTLDLKLFKDTKLISDLLTSYEK